jgi:hypothetical protein
VLRYRVNDRLLHGVLGRADLNLAFYAEQLNHILIDGSIRNPLRDGRPITLPNQMKHEKSANKRH